MLDGPINRAAFEAYVEKVLVPALRPARGAPGLETGLGVRGVEVVDDVRQSQQPARSQGGVQPGQGHALPEVRDVVQGVPGVDDVGRCALLDARQAERYSALSFSLSLSSSISLSFPFSVSSSSVFVIETSTSPLATTTSLG